MKAAISIPAQRKPDHLSRAVFSSYLACLPSAGQRGAADIVAQRWPDDRGTPLLLEGRAAVSAATTTGSGWAAELVHEATGTFLQSLSPMSAAARLIPKGLSVTFPPGASKIKIPIRPSGPVAAATVAENAPIPARAWTFATVSLLPVKLGCLIVATRQVATPETVFMALLRDDAAISLDSHVFGAGTGGLLAGLTPLTVAAGHGGYPQQVLADLALLARAAQVAGGSGETTFITAPGVAGQVSVLYPDLVVYGSSALPAARVIAVDAASLVWATGSGAPDIDVVRDATVHLDSVPGSDISTATPSQSVFQTDSLAMRMLLDVAVARRTSGGVAYSDSFDWSTAVP